MSQLVDREGVFRADIAEYRLLPKFDSGAIGVSITARLTELWAEVDGEGQWHDWAQYEMEVSGLVVIVKKDGSVNHRGCESLMQHAGWDGDPMSIQTHAWEPTPCQVVVKPDNRANAYEVFQISFVNGFNDAPRAGGQEMDAPAAKALQAQYGAQFRALAGNVQRNVPPPEGKPAPPPKPVGALTPEEAVAEGTKGDGIPF